MSERKVMIYIAMSLDGYIATHDDDISFLDSIDHTGEDYGYHDFVKTCDTYLIGRQTYDVVMKLTGGKFEQKDKFKCYVITRQQLPDQEGITFYNGRVKDLINDLRTRPGKNIYCDGGGQIIRLLLQDQLIDEFTISVIPVLLGGGKPLFPEGFSFQKLKLIGTQAYKSGLVQLRYQKV